MAEGPFDPAWLPAARVPPLRRYMADLERTQTEEEAAIVAAWAHVDDDKLWALCFERFQDKAVLAGRLHVAWLRGLTGHDYPAPRMQARVVVRGRARPSAMQQRQSRRISRALGRIAAGLQR